MNKSWKATRARQENYPQDEGLQAAPACVCLFNSVIFLLCKVQEAVVELEEAVKGGETWLL